MFWIELMMLRLDDLEFLLLVFIIRFMLWFFLFIRKFKILKFDFILNNYSDELLFWIGENGSFWIDVRLGFFWVSSNGGGKVVEIDVILEIFFLLIWGRRDCLSNCYLDSKK